MEPLTWENLPDLASLYSYNSLMELFQIKISIENQLLNEILINSKLQEILQVQENSDKEKSTTLQAYSGPDLE